MYGTFGRSTRVTIEEYRWLQDERRRAIKDLAGLGLPTLFPRPGKMPEILVCLRSKGRERNGQLRAVLETKSQRPRNKYVRNLRVPLALASTSDRRIGLREVVT